ncbi:hypothetical protein WME90_27100 [Sorangium sp. So ce375]|uniref:hypothetical protein n=1 Tax=Sorangium sp. So ce375 TaxID=3133306 RepID=UPI003F5B1173
MNQSPTEFYTDSLPEEIMMQMLESFDARGLENFSDFLVRNRRSNVVHSYISKLVKSKRLVLSKQGEMTRLSYQVLGEAGLSMSLSDYGGIDFMTPEDILKKWINGEITKL